MKHMITFGMTMLMFVGLLGAGEIHTMSNSLPERAQVSTPDILANQMIRPSEEAEIDDIPFNTLKVAEQAGIDLRYLLPNEDDIDDLPFDTAKTVVKNN